MWRMLLAAGASVKATTRIGAITPLFMASKNGSAAMIEILLKAGADANATDEHGTTALMTAAASGSTEAVKMLIDHGADVNAKEGTHGQTALMFAAALNRDAAIRTLLEHGADPSITTKALKLPKPGPRLDDGGPAPEGREERPVTGPKEPATDQKAELDALAASLGFKSAVYAAGKSDEAPDLKALVQKLSAKVD